MAVVDTNRGWRGTWCNSERDRTNRKIALSATVSRSGLGPLDLVVSDCRLQPSNENAVSMFPVEIDGRRMCSVRGANGGGDREEGLINAATSAAKLQRGKRVCLGGSRFR
jgi:hypothetical protein